MMKVSMGICPHCQMEIDIRNPSGYCDHLYYPQMCAVCNAPRAARERLRDAAPDLLAALIALHHNDGIREHEQARAAIAKATRA